MQTETCAKIIAENLARVEGVLQVRTTLSNRTVAVTYDSTKMARKNVEHLVAGLGFKTGDLEPDPAARARLPEECR